MAIKNFNLFPILLILLILFNLGFSKEVTETVTTTSSLDDNIYYPRNITNLFRGNWIISNNSSLEGLKVIEFTQEAGSILFKVINRKLIPNSNSTDNDNNSNSNSNSSEMNLSFDSLTGDLLFMDGIYNNVNSVRYSLFGVYEYNTGIATSLIVPTFNFNGKNPLNFTIIDTDISDTEMLENIKTQIYDFANNITTLDFNATQGISFINQAEQEKYQSMVIQFTLKFSNVSKDYNNFEVESSEFDETIVESIGTFFTPLLPLEVTMTIKNVVLSAYRGKLMNYIVMISLSSFVQIILMLKQMEFTNTQSSAAKVSILTIGMQTILDAYMFLIHLSAGVLIESMFNAFAIASFFQFVTFSLFEMRYLFVILKANRPQAFADGWVQIRREFSVFYLRFYTCLISGFFIMYYFSSIFKLFLFIMYSFWVPQIILNVQKSVRRPFLWKYVLGISGTRLLVPLYFIGCPNNFVPLEPNYPYSIALVLWMGLQVAILYFQSKWGPTFFIPKSFLPPKYQYIRPIPQIIKNRENGSCCVICMCDVEEIDEYMITPCEHLFHSKCLLQWMEFKMECPTCRQVLPPS